MKWVNRKHNHPAALGIALPREHIVGVTELVDSVVDHVGTGQVFTGEVMLRGRTVVWNTNRLKAF